MPGTETGTERRSTRSVVSAICSGEADGEFEVAYASGGLYDDRCSTKCRRGGRELIRSHAHRLHLGVRHGRRPCAGPFVLRGIMPRILERGVDSSQSMAATRDDDGASRTSRVPHCAVRMRAWSICSRPKRTCQGLRLFWSRSKRCLVLLHGAFALCSPAGHRSRDFFAICSIFSIKSMTRSWRHSCLTMGRSVRNDVSGPMVGSPATPLF